MQNMPPSSRIVVGRPTKLMPFTKSIQYLALNCQWVYLNRKNAVTAWASMTKTLPCRFAEANCHCYVLGVDGGYC